MNLLSCLQLSSTERVELTKGHKSSVYSEGKKGLLTKTLPLQVFLLEMCLYSSKIIPIFESGKRIQILKHDLFIRIQPKELNGRACPSSPRCVIELCLWTHLNACCQDTEN